MLVGEGMTWMVLRLVDWVTRRLVHVRSRVVYMSVFVQWCFVNRWRHVLHWSMFTHR